MELERTTTCPTCGHEIHYGIQQLQEPIRCVCGSTITPAVDTQITAVSMSPKVRQSAALFDDELANKEHPEIKAPPIDPAQGFCLMFAALSLLTTCGPPAGFIFGYRTYREAERLLNLMHDGSTNANFEKMIRICWWLGIAAMTVNSILVSILVIWIALQIVRSI